MDSRIRTIYIHGLNKGLSSKFSEGYNDRHVKVNANSQNGMIIILAKMEILIRAYWLDSWLSFMTYQSL